MSRAFIIGLVLQVLMTASSMQARLQVDPAVVDIQRTLLPSAKVIFRGRVVSVDIDASDPSRFIASFEPDRWYRGTQTASPILSFAYGGTLGHDCIPFQPGTYWILFATVEGDRRLKLVDDCYGALAVSPRLGPDILESGLESGMIGQMEADFEAGVDDADPAARLLSIQRLGNLKLPAARPVLHGALSNSSDREKPWIVLAALRTGDAAVLPQASSMLRGWHRNRGGEVEGMIALELSSLTDPSAVPGLIEILDSAPETLVKDCALQALGETLRDARALASIAPFLGNADRYLNHSALVGMWNITHAPACSPIGQSTEEDFQTAAKSCKSWWDSEGKLQTWEQQQHDSPSVPEH